jgi:hypothetical protein
MMDNVLAQCIFCLKNALKKTKIHKSMDNDLYSRWKAI